MALSEATKKKVIAKLKVFEGSIPHLYLDTKGYVTVGIGHLISNRTDMKRVKMHTVKNKLPDKLATLAEKQTEFDTIKALTKGKKASAYKKDTTLVMKDTEIQSLKGTHVKNFYANLTADYTVANGYANTFDDLHENVQLALFDMIFNLGRSGLKKKFPTFNQAIKDENWSKAATESNRPDVGKSRNTYVKRLFETIPVAIITKPISSGPPSRPIIGSRP